MQTWREPRLQNWNRMEVGRIKLVDGVLTALIQHESV